MSTPNESGKSGIQPDRQRSRKYRLREQEIIDAAGDVFSEQGYASATLSDVADRVGMLPGSLYYYIDSKEDLLYKITMHIHALANVVLDEALARSTDPLERLGAVVEAHFRSTAANSRLTRVFYSEFRHIQGEGRDEVLALRRSYEDRVLDAIVSASDAGYICSRRDRRVEMIAVLTLLNGIHTWFDPNGRVSLDGVTEIYREFVVNGLRCDHDSCQPNARSSIAHLVNTEELRQ